MSLRLAEKFHPGSVLWAVFAQDRLHTKGDQWHDAVAELSGSCALLVHGTSMIAAKGLFRGSRSLYDSLASCRIWRE